LVLISFSLLAPRLRRRVRLAPAARGPAPPVALLERPG
jgi:hypothetical protein